MLDTAVLRSTRYDYPMRATLAGWTAFGDLVLQNRAALVDRIAASRADASDLEVVLQLVIARGFDAIRHVVGPFALIFASSYRPKVVLARDALGLRPLYYRSNGRRTFVGSRAAPISEHAEFDREYIAEFLVNGRNPDHRTAYAGTLAVQAGSFVEIEDGRAYERRFWSASEIELDEEITLSNACDEVRAGLEDAIRVSVASPGVTWAALSGGIDSSSVVSVACTLAERGEETRPSGTVTIVDTLGSADERIYTAAVLDRYPVRNEIIDFGWPWKDIALWRSVPDLPYTFCIMLTTAQLVHDRISSAGGMVYLTGVGPDHLMGPNRTYLADLLARWRWRRAFGELLRSAVGGRRSAWSILFRDGLVPQMPVALRLRYAARDARVPSWLEPNFVRQYDIVNRLGVVRRLSAPHGKKFVGTVQYELEHLAERGLAAEQDISNLDIRHPFLYRPLVESILRLPPWLRYQPRARKLILREALRDVLPDAVRTRTTKGTCGARIVWAFNRESATLRHMLRAPMLADLGCIDVVRLRRHVEAVIRGRHAGYAALLSPLALETWLRQRSGTLHVPQSGVGAETIPVEHATESF